MSYLTLWSHGSAAEARVAFEILEEFTERHQRILVVIGILGRLCTAALGRLPALLPPAAVLLARV